MSSFAFRSFSIALGFLLGQVLGQVEAGLVEEVVEGRDGLHESADEACGRALAVATCCTTVLDGDLVDVDALDGFDLCLDEFGQFLEQEE